MSRRWDLHFLARAHENAKLSKDPNTQVGSVLVMDRIGRSDGYNGLPRVLEDSEARLNDREVKMSMVICAERNAVLNAARQGIATKGSTLYLVATDPTGEVWGGPPCTRCTLEIIQAGIVEVVSPPKRTRPSKWHADMAVAHAWMAEAGIAYREVELEPDA